MPKSDREKRLEEMEANAPTEAVVVPDADEDGWLTKAGKALGILRKSPADRTRERLAKERAEAEERKRAAKAAARAFALATAPPAMPKVTDLAACPAPLPLDSFDAYAEAVERVHLLKQRRDAIEAEIRRVMHPPEVAGPGLRTLLDVSKEMPPIGSAGRRAVESRAEEELLALHADRRDTWKALAIAEAEVKRQAALCGKLAAEPCRAWAAAAVRRAAEQMLALAETWREIRDAYVRLDEAGIPASALHGNGPILPPYGSPGQLAAYVREMIEWGVLPSISPWREASQQETPAMPVS